VVSRFLAVAAGGSLGSVARYAVSLVVARFWSSPFPLATFVVNVVGCFVLGFFSTVASERLSIDPAWRLLVATGFVGAFTTFSTFEYETHRLTEVGSLGWAAANVLVSLAAGFLAVRLGVAVAR
jgi:CrcB protein